MSSCRCSMIRVFQCEDNLTGILTGVYDAWASRLGHSGVRLVVGESDQELFCEYETVETDLEKAEKVLRTVRGRMGEEAALMIAGAAACTDGDKADMIYRMIALGLSLPDGRRICGMLGHPVMQRMLELSRRAGNIASRYMEFIRFRETAGGVLLSVIDAEADVLALIAPHFADRLPLEHWLIYDRRREKAAVHPAGKSWFLAEEVREDALREMEDSREEEQFGALWKCFHRAVAIEERKNPGLQNSFLPLKFRGLMKEFEPDGETTTAKGPKGLKTSESL
ncbi:MAG: TIGR03915 family putative DNA repair protein [Eubacteriales bacterium]|nr:TIGR03915 family putative DNA repair protein [Eubacteriales bacterium]